MKKISFKHMLAYLANTVLWALTLQATELQILHTNDMHAHVLGVKSNDGMCTPTERSAKNCFGGFDRIYTQVQKERAKNIPTLLLDAGDQFQGTMFHQLYHGIVSARFMNYIGYDAMAVGNHEFDDGPLILSNFINEIKFPIISVNIDTYHSAELKNKIKPYVIVHKNNIKIGIIGYTTEDTAYLSNPGVHIKFKPILENVKKAVLTLKNQHVDVIIALSHAGLAKDIEIAKSVNGIAAIVCGHSNSLLSNSAPKSDGPSPLVIRSPNNKPVLLVSAYAYGKYLGYLKFSFDKTGVPIKWSGDPILLDSSIRRDEKISQEALKYYEPIAAIEKEYVGFAPKAIEAKDCRFKECVLGNFIGDALLYFALPMGVDLALMNAGGIRASIPHGKINRAHIKDALPFEKKIVLLKLKGSVIKQIIEHGVTYAENRNNDNTGRFLQVAGLKYAFDPQERRGHRVWKIEIFNKTLKRFEPLNMQKIYGVVSNAYIVNGGDNYHFFNQALERWHMDVELKEILHNYFKNPLSQLSKLDGRILTGPRVK